MKGERTIKFKIHMPDRVKYYNISFHLLLNANNVII